MAFIGATIMYDWPKVLAVCASCSAIAWVAAKASGQEGGNAVAVGVAAICACCLCMSAINWFGKWQMAGPVQVATTPTKK